MTMTPARSSPFAEMARDPLHPDVIYRDQRCFVIRDIDPKAPVHLLLIPNMPINGLAYVGPGQVPIMGHLFVVAEEMARREGVALSGYRLVINNGPDAGQTIAWPHVHLLGGRALGDMG
jgi:histidine triad (HIT) family protein